MNEKLVRRWIFGSYIIGILFTPLTFTPLIVDDVVPGKYGLRHFMEPGGWVYTAYFGFFAINATLGLYKLGQAFFSSRGPLRNQLRYLFIGSLVGYAGGVDNFLLVYDIALFPFYPYGTYAVGLYVFSTAYAIIAHKLLDVEFIVRRTAIFAGLFAFVYGIFSIVTFFGQEFFKDTLGWNQWLAMVPTVLIVILAVRPLENILATATERFLFQKKYDYRQLLKKFATSVLTTIDLSRLLKETIEGIVTIMKLESAAILLIDRDARLLRLACASGVDPHVRFEVESFDLLYNFLVANDQPIKREAVMRKGFNAGIDNLMHQFKSELCIPICHNSKALGLLLLGAKKSGDDFRPEDLDVLMTLAKTEAIAITNARLFDDLSKIQAEAAQKEKMAVIGTLAAGINHEICNPLGIVRGQCEMFLLNMRDGFYENKSREDLVKLCGDIMNKVIRETDRATAITKKLSGFAKPSKNNDMEEVLIEREVQEVLGLLGQDLKLNNIDIQTDIPANFPVFLADRKQIEEVLFNIIRNGAQAIDKKQGKILVSGFAQNGSAIIRIADNGSGIPKESLEKIFHPFYTTKAPGKGTGLGLFIVKQIVERNRGTIAVESEVGIGTTFTLKFPTAVKAITAAA